MEKQVQHLKYSSTITDFCEINSSFDSAVLRIAYHGLNRKKVNISKEAFEKAANSIFNCPVVTNYDRETGDLGDHDMAVVRDYNDDVKIVNLTVPIGVVPESAKQYWETVIEENGEEHEYYCTEVLIWKRQEAYAKLKEDGIAAQSMEISVLDSELKDGVLYVNDFIYTAFCLIGVAPVFESSHLEFSMDYARGQFEEMKKELEALSKVGDSSYTEDSNISKFSEEGGESLENKELIENQETEEISTVVIDVDVDKEEVAETEVEETTPDTDDETSVDQNYSLNSTNINAFFEALKTRTVTDRWGDEVQEYFFEDYDAEAGKVYVTDSKDWLLYGFDYKPNGDKVDIDFDSKKRYKFTIAEFDEGETIPTSNTFADAMNKVGIKFDEATAAVEEANKKIEELNDQNTQVFSELEELRAFKTDTENKAIESERKEGLENVFSMFSDLENIDDFKAIKDECASDCMKYSLDDVEEKCYAIRGKNMQTVKFSLEQKPIRQKVAHEESVNNEPYGDLFETFGRSKN